MRSAADWSMPGSGPVVDVNSTLLAALELVYEQCRPEVRGLWDAQIDPHLRIRTDTRPLMGDWRLPWLELAIEPSPYLEQTVAIRGSQAPVGALQDRAVERIVSLDRDGIDVAVLHPEGFAGPAAAVPGTVAAGLLGGYNRYAGTYCQAAPERLKAVIQLHGQEVEWSVHEIDRLRERDWVAGAAINMSSSCSAGSDALAPIFHALEAADLPVLHRCELRDSPHFPGYRDVWDDVELAYALGPTWDAQRYVTALLVAGVFDRHPGLRVCTVDGGAGWLVAWVDRLADLDDGLGARAETLLADGRFVATVGGHERDASIGAVVDAFGDRCLVWGSGMAPDAAAAPDPGPPDLPAGLEPQILFENPARLLGPAVRASIHELQETAT